MALFNVKLSILALCLFITAVLSAKFEIRNRIINGHDSENGFFPYYVLLRGSEESFICGGVIISKWHVLTAAHNLLGLENAPEKIVASFGVTQLNDDTPNFPIEKMSIHPKFNSAIFHNDVALLKMVNEIQFSHFIQPIPVIETNLEDAGGLKATICGLGLIRYSKEGVKMLPNILQYQNMNTISNAECRKQFEKLYYENHDQWQNVMGTLHGNAICTANRIGTGACLGDSGGPLVVNGILIGILSSSVGCAQGYPVIYTNVYDYLTWITDQM